MSDLARSEEQGNRGALDGVRVLDLTHQVAGPSATLMLAFLGAEVVKVIAPGSRDSYDSIAFYLNNASKKSVELDLKTDAGREAALRLADHADIFVENFSPGVIDRLGLSWEVLSGRNPGLIYAQVKGSPRIRRTGTSRASTRSPRGSPAGPPSPASRTGCR